MTVNEIKIRKTFKEGNLRAILSVTIDNCFAIHEIKVIDGGDRLFVAMSSRKDECGVFRDIIHPICKESRESFEKTVLNAYENYIRLEEIMSKKGE